MSKTYFLQLGFEALCKALWGNPCTFKYCTPCDMCHGLLWPFWARTFLLYILTIWTSGGLKNKNINLLADRFYPCSVRLSLLDCRLGCRYTGVWWGNVRERDHLEEPGVDGRIILRLMFRKWDVGAWTGLVWLMIGTGSGHLRAR
jgi:hypothetical protein